MSVIIYTTPHCMWCKRAKEYFQERGLNYDEVDVSIDEIRESLPEEKQGIFGTPVIEIDGTVIIGFDRVMIDKTLKAMPEHD